jgi:hypothetical protein
MGQLTELGDQLAEISALLDTLKDAGGEFAF